MIFPTILSKVILEKTNDANLDNLSAVIVGFYGKDVIIMFDNPPINYYSAIIISPSYLKNVSL